MAWDFEYIVNIDLMHPSFDPEMLSNRMANLTPTNTAKAGESVRMNSGRTRVSSYSVWQARLHSQQRLHSSSSDLTDVLLASLNELTQYGEIFHEICQSGHAFLQIVIFSDSKHSAVVIPATILDKCASLGLDLDLEFYAPE